MRLKLYRAASMADAMAQLRDELGPEALILSTRRVAGGVELTAGLEQPDEPPPERRPATVFDPVFHGIPPRLANRLSGRGLAEGLRSALRFSALPLPPHPATGRPLMMAGPPGAGKTLTVARLATRLVLGGVAPLVVTADARRAGGAEELAAYTRLLGLTLLAAGTPAALTRALAQAEGVPVLIDTAGADPFAAADTQMLSGLMEAAGGMAVLVMPAGAHPDEAAEQAAAFAGLGIGHLLPTRLDLARRLGSVLAAADAGLILTEAGIGPGAADGLVQITPEFLAERLEGKPAHGPEARTLRAPVFPSARSRAAAHGLEGAHA